MTRRRTPKARTPDLPPWDKGECRRCATPVRRVYFIGVTDELPAVEVGMKPAPRSDPRARVAAVPMNNRLEGRWLSKTEHAEQVETVWIPHRDVCPEIPRPTQLELPQEGTT